MGGPRPPACELYYGSVRIPRQTSAFADRRVAGRELARALRPLVADEDVLVLGLPRGGVPVAAEVATGATMRAAADAARLQEPSRLIVAVPVAPRETVRAFEQAGVEIVCLRSPEPFLAVGFWYGNFSPTTDAEVTALLQRAA